MSEAIRKNRPYIRRRAHRGQTLFVALAVLFVLLFIGGVFVAQVASNLTAAGRSSQQQVALALAQAGAKYCDSQLTDGTDGADWRPAPTAPFDSAADPRGLSDPDYFWLSKGFHRMELEGGRALVRVTYEPRPDDPRSQMLKVESIGRPGDLAGGLDPTLFVQNGPAPRLRRELIGYKQIGLTDYARYITGKDGTNRENAIGTPATGRSVATVLGDPTVAQFPSGVNGSNILFAYPIYAAGNLTFFGDVYLYASPRGTNPNVSPEGIQVSGEIKLSPTRDVNNDGNIDEEDRQVYVNQLINAAPSPSLALLPSNDPLFNSFDARVRDGSSLPDNRGVTRGIPRLPAPLIDSPIAGTGGVSRYRQITRESGQWLTQDYNTGFGGWGRHVYINNPDDAQREAEGVSGSYSLRSDWLNPRAGFGYWEGPFYRPPGILVELLGDRIRLTRSDGRAFVNPRGETITQQGGKVIEIPLRDSERQSYVLPDGTAYRLPALDHDGDEPGATGKPFSDPDSYGSNLVIYSEGNIRVRGVYGVGTSGSLTDKLARVHLTLVTNGTAYIEGNLVKGDADRASTCAILAKDYVCVNTTMFMAPQNQANVWNRASFGAQQDVFYTQIGLSRPSYDAAFSWGVNPSSYGSSPSFLMLRHAGLGGPSYLNLLVNPALATDPTAALYPFYSDTPPPVSGLETSRTYALGLTPVGAGAGTTEPLYGTTPYFEQRAFALTGLSAALPLFTTPGYENMLRFQLDPSIAATLGIGGSADYVLGGAMVAPMDIRIEALLYAQEKSFFIIPGFSMNSDPTDTREAFLRTNTRPSFLASDTPELTLLKSVYPFYGEPMDVRLTLYGAIAENYTASMGDQAAWMERWGYIPETHGSSGEYVPKDHLDVHDPDGYIPGEDRTAEFRTPTEKSEGITRGLRFVYDPALAMPYLKPADTATYSSDGTRRSRALRFLRRAAILNGAGDQVLPAFDQPLPPMPRLPVCPGLLYFGDPDRPIGS